MNSATTYLTVVLKDGYEGEEIGALETILIEAIWVSVAGCHNDHPIVEQLCKQSLQDHCITNVCHLQVMSSVI